MKLIIGLGNPGDEYKFTRHNVGFLVLEELARESDIRFKSNKRFMALTGEGEIERERVFLAMPQTFMNLSGSSVRSMLRWLKISPADVFVVVDDIALPFNSIRVRPKGSSGGHKGLNSIIDAISTQEFPRIRIGILGRKNVKDLSKYVLGRFTIAEQKNLPDILSAASKACACWVKEGVDAAMNQYNNLAL